MVNDAGEKGIQQHPPGQWRLDGRLERRPRQGLRRPDPGLGFIFRADFQRHKYRDTNQQAEPRKPHHESLTPSTKVTRSSLNCPGSRGNVIVRVAGRASCLLGGYFKQDTMW
jgi:hypothetical protein